MPTQSVLIPDALTFNSVPIEPLSALLMADTKSAHLDALQGDAFWRSLARRVHANAPPAFEALLEQQLIALPACDDEQQLLPLLERPSYRGWIAHYATISTKLLQYSVFQMGALIPHAYAHWVHLLYQIPHLDTLARHTLYAQCFFELLLCRTRTDCLPYLQPLSRALVSAPDSVLALQHCALITYMQHYANAFLDSGSLAHHVLTHVQAHAQHQTLQRAIDEHPVPSPIVAHEVLKRL